MLKTILDCVLIFRKKRKKKGKTENLFVFAGQDNLLTHTKHIGSIVAFSGSKFIEFVQT